MPYAAATATKTNRPDTSNSSDTSSDSNTTDDEKDSNVSDDEMHQPSGSHKTFCKHWNIFQNHCKPKKKRHIGQVTEIISQVRSPGHN